MTAPRLIRLVPTGEVFQGVDLVEPCEVQPLSEEQIIEIAKLFGMEGKFSERAFAHAIEKAHGIGRRMDA